MAWQCVVPFAPLMPERPALAAATVTVTVLERHRDPSVIVPYSEAYV